MESIWAQGKNFRISTEYLNIASGLPLKNTPQIQERFGNSDPNACKHHGGKKGIIQKQKIFPIFRPQPRQNLPENSDAIMDVTETAQQLKQTI